MYNYYIYGIGVHSEIKLYELDERKVRKDVLIHYGVLPEELRGLLRQGITRKMDKNRVWFCNDYRHFVIS